MKRLIPLVLVTLSMACDNHARDYRDDNRPGIVYDDKPAPPVRTPWGLMSAKDYAELQRLKNRPRTATKEPVSTVRVQGTVLTSEPSAAASGALGGKR